MASTNVYFAWNTRTDVGVLSGGSWLSTLPLPNLQTKQVQKVARSNGVTLGATQFSIDLGAAYAIDGTALVVHNMGASAKVRISGSSDNFATTTFTSGWVDVWPSGIIPQYLLEWEDDNFWLGTMTAAQRAGYQSPFIYLLATAQILRYWKFEIDDTTNSAGYVQIGRLFMAKGFRPTYNMSYGADLGYNDPADIETSLSGAEYFNLKSKYRVHNFTLEFLSASEGYQQILDMQRTMGITGEVLIVPDSSDAATSGMRNMLGRMEKLGALSQPFFNTYSIPMTIKELI